MRSEYADNENVKSLGFGECVITSRHELSLFLSRLRQTKETHSPLNSHLKSVLCERR